MFSLNHTYGIIIKLPLGHSYIESAQNANQLRLKKKKCLLLGGEVLSHIPLLAPDKAICNCLLMLGAEFFLRLTIYFIRAVLN